MQGVKNKKQLKVLSIDADIFCDFGSTFLPGTQQTEIAWAITYNTWGGVINECVFYNKIHELIKKKIQSSSCPIHVSENHSHITTILTEQYGECEFDIVNYDRHSDADPGGLELNCANWLRFLDKTNEVRLDWVLFANEYYTEVYSPMCGRIISTTNIKDCQVICNKAHRLDEDYDLIFIIQSADYNPPHLYHKFRELYAGLNIIMDTRFPVVETTYESDILGLIQKGILLFISETEEYIIFLDKMSYEEYGDDDSSEEDYYMKVNKTASFLLDMFDDVDPMYLRKSADIQAIDFNK